MKKEERGTVNERKWQRVPEEVVDYTRILLYSGSSQVVAIKVMVGVVLSVVGRLLEYSIPRAARGFRQGGCRER